MKILMVNKFLYPRGGAETYFLKLGKYFECHGHEVSYFGMYDKKNTVGNSYNLYALNKDFRNKKLTDIFYPLEIIYSIDAYKKMTKIIKKFQPDIIHMNNINFQLTPSIIDAAYKCKIPIIQTIHDSQMICPAHLLYKDKKLCTECIEKSKWRCTKNKCIHGSFLKSFLGSVEGILYDRKKTYDKVDLYICPSKFIEKVLHTNSRFLGKTIKIPNFIEKKQEREEKKKYILFFGRISEEKGIEYLIEAAKQLRNIPFVIAGDGPLRGLCLGHSNIEYVGMKVGSELDRLISSATFTISPSLCHENCSLSILESISLGTPVISSSRGGSKELIRDGETGILLKEPISVDEIVKEIKLLWENEEQIQKMNQACWAERDKILDIEEYGRIIEEIYDKLRKEKRK